MDHHSSFVNARVTNSILALTIRVVSVTLVTHSNILESSIFNDFIEDIMANKSGKAKSNSKYTDLHQIMEEIDLESETDFLFEESLSIMIQTGAEELFLQGWDVLLDG